MQGQTRTANITCDSCGDYISATNDPMTPYDAGGFWQNLRDDAKSKGWREINSKDFCPHCSSGQCVADLEASLPTATKIAAFVVDDEILIVGLDDHGDPIDPDGALFGEGSGRDVEEYQKYEADLINGGTIHIGTKTSVRVEY